MSESDKDNIALNQSTLVCRGCLKEWGEMKNMYHWGLDADFFKHTEIPKSEGLPELLCSSCESDLKKVMSFKETCQASNRVLQLNLERSKGPTASAQVTSVIDNKTVIVKITAPNPEEKVKLICPIDNCTSFFIKTVQLQYHLKNVHGIDVADIELQFYCTKENCIHNINSNRNKFFTGRKFLNQHLNKKHKDKTYVCDSCQTKFSTESDFTRHLKTCDIVYFCNLCQKMYATNETYLVHLMRKHPKLHAKYKRQRKEKRPGVIDLNEYSDMIDASKPKKARLNELFGNAIVRPLIGSPAKIIPLRTGIPAIFNTELSKLKPPEIVNDDKSPENNDKNTNEVLEKTKAVPEIVDQVMPNATETRKDSVENKQNLISKLTYDVKPIRVYPAKITSKQKDVGEIVNKETATDIIPEVVPIQIDVSENIEISSDVNEIAESCEMEKLSRQIRVKAISELEEDNVPKELEPIEITRFPPWSGDDVFETTIYPDGEFVDDYIAQEEIIFEGTVELDSSAMNNEFLVGETMNIEYVNQDPMKNEGKYDDVLDIPQYFKEDSMNNEPLVEVNMNIDSVIQDPVDMEQKYENNPVTDIPKYYKDDSMNILVEESMNIGNITEDSVEVEEKYENNAATDNPKNITNDVSLNNGCGTQTDEISTQTDAFTGLFSMKSQPSADDDDFSATVLLADIQTQTSPLEFGISRCNKETQACTSNNMKQTQTCYCFDSLSNHSTNFISTETQTLDLESPVHSDELLSFTSAETQTCMEDSAEGSF